MNRDYFSVETSEYMQFGRCTNSMLDTMTPESAREVPCGACEYENECAVKALECVAFRQWAADGDYMDKDVGRLRRAMK